MNLNHRRKLGLMNEYFTYIFYDKHNIYYSFSPLDPRQEEPCQLFTSILLHVTLIDPTIPHQRLSLSLLPFDVVISLVISLVLHALDYFQYFVSSFERPQLCRINIIFLSCLSRSFLFLAYFLWRRRRRWWRRQHNTAGFDFIFEVFLLEIFLLIWFGISVFEIRFRLGILRFVLRYVFFCGFVGGYTG